MSTTGDEPSGDYSYDLAHEDVPGTEPTAPEEPSAEPPVPAPGTAPDTDGDYSYDLAHEVPQAGPGPASL